MFTGIILDIGRSSRRAHRARRRCAAGAFASNRLDLSRTAVGDSICVQGCCVTAVALGTDRFRSRPVARDSGLDHPGRAGGGFAVNLEPALRAGDALGGHLVSGHVDGLATVVSRTTDARSTRMVIEAPPALARYIARKGSITVDGVSLTVNEVDGARFGVNLIPHTLEVTTLGALAPGTAVNLEIDQVARYVERLLAPGYDRRL